MVRGSERTQLLGRHPRKFSSSESRRGYYYCAGASIVVDRKLCDWLNRALGDLAGNR